MHYGLASDPKVAQPETKYAEHQGPLCKDHDPDLEPVPVRYASLTLGDTVRWRGYDRSLSSLFQLLPFRSTNAVR